MISMSQEDKDLIVSRLKEIRSDNGLTLKEIGAIMGVSDATVCRYETGEIENIPLQRIKMLAQTYGLNPAWIMGMSDKKFMYGRE